MAGTSRYKLVKKLLEGLEVKRLKTNDLRGLIMRELASDTHVITKYLKLMSDSGLITEKEPNVFEVNV